MVSTQNLVDTMRKDAVRMSVEPVRVTRNGRRYFSAAHKRAVVERCLAPGASLAAVALASGFNANLVRKWVRQHDAALARGARTAKLLPVIIGSQRVTTRRGRAHRVNRAIAPMSLASSGVEIHVGAARIVVSMTPDMDVLRTVLDLMMNPR